MEKKDKIIFIFKLSIYSSHLFDSITFFFFFIML